MVAAVPNAVIVRAAVYCGVISVITIIMIICNSISTFTAIDYNMVSSVPNAVIVRAAVDCCIIPGIFNGISTCAAVDCGITTTIPNAVIIRAAINFYVLCVIPESIVACAADQCRRGTINVIKKIIIIVAAVNVDVFAFKIFNPVVTCAAVYCSICAGIFNRIGTRFAVN